jgi:hypothetical protein
MPRWGQLGCNGFIVLDGQKRVVSRQTAAFLQMRGLAFQHVEAILDALLAGSAPPMVCPAQCVALEGVEDPKKRGLRGVALDATNPDDGKNTVFLLSGSGGGSMVRVASTKLRVLPGNAIEISPRQLAALEQARAVALAARRQAAAPAGAPGAGGASASKDDSGCEGNSEQAPALRKRNAQGESKAGEGGAEGDAAGDATADVALGPVRVASVLNAELDRQHEECAAALEELASQRSTCALDAALRAIRRHFEYEERLLDQHLYHDLCKEGGGGGDGFNGFSADASMRTSHFADHTRIISTMEEKLAELQGCGDGGGGMGGGTCGASGG